MAGALASALVEEVAKKLASKTRAWLATVIREEWELRASFEEDLRSMTRAFTDIQEVLEDAENRCIMPDRESRKVSDWLKRLKEAADDIADFLDEIEREEAAEQREQIQNRSANMVCDCFSILWIIFSLFNTKDPKANHEVARKMKSLRKRLDEIADEKNKFQLLSGTAISDSWKEFHRGRESIAIIDESEIVGRKKDEENIIKLVLDMNIAEEKNVSVIPVVGLGGLGKTTLAQVVFNDSRVKETGGHFDLRVWVCVSEDFSLEAIGKRILSATKTSCDLDTLNDITNSVAEIFKEKRFLLVLDDVWNEDPRKWNKVKVLFQEGKRGSKILVTTRSVNVASVMGTIYEPYSLVPLSDGYCWHLFKRVAFAEGEERNFPSLADIGRREIVPKCGGVPLAVTALGGMLRHKRTIAEWEAVRDSEIWELEDDEILPSLRLSYVHMPSNLKHCFAYCSVFPKDHQIDKDNLINQWIALEFISSEVTGSQYFNDLLSMSFLQEPKESIWTERLEYKMHDLVHDLARLVAGDEVSIVEGDQALEIPRGCRYFSLIHLCSEELSKPEIPVVTRKLRALHLLYSGFPRMLSDETNSLRVLHLEYAWHATEFLDSFKGYEQLRYLYLSGNKIREVPESLFGLYDLQTLNLSGCHSLKSLPDSIARLQSLQNLDLCDSGLQRTLKFDVGFQNLQSLDFSRCHELTILHESIGCLAKLRTLSLRGCRRLKNLPDSLGRLQSLQYLNLSMTSIVALPEDIGSLENLQTLCLHDCGRFKQLPHSIGKLQNLRTLDLSSCCFLQKLPSSISDLLNLEKLDISLCWEITELPQEMQKMDKLRHLLNERTFSCRMPRGIGKLANLLALQTFLVSEQGSGQYEYASIVELQHLDHLSGQLEIRRLENVEHPEEATSANLEAKEKLRSLTLHWGSRGSRDEEVLQKLQPHPSLEALTIEGYKGNKYPSWMTSGNLVEIKLESCRSLPPLGRLPYLKILTLRKMDVRLIGSEFYGGDDWATPFQSLEELTLEGMRDLEEWLTTIAVDDNEGSRQVSAYPRLTKLWIEDCEKLRPQPCLPTSLVSLRVDSSAADFMESLLKKNSQEIADMTSGFLACTFRLRP